MTDRPTLSVRVVTMFAKPAKTNFIALPILTDNHTCNLNHVGGADQRGRHNFGPLKGWPFQVDFEFSDAYLEKPSPMSKFNQSQKEWNLSKTTYDPLRCNQQ